MSCRPLALFFLAATALLSACGDGKDGNNEQAVAMRDMEVVDGTATDAMTDLDGVQTEGIALPPAPGAAPRSEEHTSELQSLMRLSYAVFCLKTKHTITK